jgi:hypothetical protein
LRDRWKIQDLKTALLLQVADEIILMHPLHDHDDTRRCLVVAAGKQGGPVPSEPHQAERALRHAVVGTSPAYAATKGAIDTLVKHFASLRLRGVP